MAAGCGDQTVTFCLQQAETSLGETVRVVGSVEALGCWDPELGVVLETRPELYPQWTADVALNQDSNIEYKYVRDKRALGGNFEWETVANRLLRVAVEVREGHQLVKDPGFNQLVQAEDSGSSEGEVTPGVGFGLPLTIECSRESGKSPEPLCQEVPLPSSLTGLEVLATGRFEEDYALLSKEPLDFGTFGAVWLCRRKNSEDGEGGCKRAAKCVEKSRLQQRDLRNLFGSDCSEGEIRIHAMQKHPHIVQLFEVFDEPANVTLVLEICEGGDLFRCVASQRMSHGTGLAETSAKRVLLHLLDALHFLHEQRIVHRDVKCENVLLHTCGVPVEENTFKLCDFGFAGRVPIGGWLHDPMGSPDAVAPEVVRRLPYATAVDLWGAGVLLYITLSGTMPFSGDTAQDLLKKVRVGDYSLEGATWQRISDSAKELLRGLMTVDPFKRLTAAVAMEHPWLRGQQSTEAEPLQLSLADSRQEPGLDPESQLEVLTGALQARDGDDDHFSLTAVLTYLFLKIRSCWSD